MVLKNLGIATVVVAIISWLIISNREDAQREEAQRISLAKHELARISTPDPLVNLAGCMANNMTEVSRILLSKAVHKTVAGLHMPPEEIQQFYEIRDALYQECAATYQQKILERHGSYSYADLNRTFIEVLQNDGGVASYLKIYSDLSTARKASYAK